MRREAWKIGAALLATLCSAVWVEAVYGALGVHEPGGRASKNRDATCMRFRGLQGARDIVYLEGTLFATACDFRNGRKNPGGPAGDARVGLFVLSIEGSDLYRSVVPNPVRLEGFPKGVDFRPESLSYHRESRDLYVVNHAYGKGGERVDVFNLDLPDMDEGYAPPPPSPRPAHSMTHTPHDNSEVTQMEGFEVRAVYLRSIIDPLFAPGTLGTILSLDKEGFVVASNGYPHGPDGPSRVTDALNVAVTYGLFRRPSVLLWCPGVVAAGRGDGGAYMHEGGDGDGGCRVASKGFYTIGGMARDSGGKLWVSDLLPRQMTVFKHRGRGELVLQTTVKTPVPVFGMQYDYGSDSIALAGTQRLASTLANIHVGAAPAASVSHVIDVATKRVTPLLPLSSAQLSSATAAALVPGSNSVLFGSPVDDGLLLCDAPRRTAGGP